MAKATFEIRLKPSKGLVDGLDPQDLPPEAVEESIGFEYRRGYARTELGRAAYNTSEISSGERIYDIFRWDRPGKTPLQLAFAEDAMWYDTATGIDFDNILSKFGFPSNVNTATGTLSASSLTVTVTGARIKKSLRVGDKFYFASDTLADAKAVATIPSDTTITFATAYAGSSSSGPFWVKRPITGTEVNMVAAGGRVLIADGSGPVHWFGPASTSLTDTTIFRECGLPAPDPMPQITASANAGSLSAGTYSWRYAWEDRRRSLGPPVQSPKFVATAADAAVFTPASSPAWAEYMRVWRTKKDKTGMYHIASDVDDYATVQTSGITATLDYGGLTPHLHKHRMARFASGTEYRILDNTISELVLAATASSETDGKIEVRSGWQIDGVESSGVFIDYAKDDDLDTAFEAPSVTTIYQRSENEGPPTGLKYLCVFNGGGRLCGLEDGTQTRIWFSGRQPEAPKKPGTERWGEGEFDHWPHYQDCGPADGDVVQRPFTLQTRLFVAKKKSIWALYKEDNNVVRWSFYPRVQGVGCSSPWSLDTRAGAAYWWGHDGMQSDVIRFDGEFAHGMLRPKLRATVDEPKGSAANFAGAIFKGKYYLSYARTSAADNSRTLRYDIKTRTVDKQGWGAFRFSKPYLASGVGYMLAAAPGATSLLYKVDASSSDAGTAVTREIRWPDVALRDAEHRFALDKIALEVVIG